MKPPGCAAVLLLTAVVSVAAPAGKPVQSDAGVAAELRRATQELMSAVAKGDWAVWDKYLDDSILYTAEDGRTLTKAQLREEMKPLPPGFSGTIDVESADVRQYGDVAVVSHEVLEHETVFGQNLVSHYHTTDTWLRKGGRWRLIATQVLVRLADPPAATVDPRTFDDYVGHYAVSPTMTLEVRAKGTSSSRSATAVRSRSSCRKRSRSSSPRARRGRGRSSPAMPAGRS